MLTLQEAKKLWKPFVLIFFLALIAVNWNSISWIFNYRAFSRYAEDFFEKKPVQEQAVIKAPEEKESKLEPGVEIEAREDGIEISRIGIGAPLIVNKTLNDAGVQQSLDKGVVLYPSSVLPGQPGQTVILGHSAPPAWPKIKYDWVFSRINDLLPGDEILIYYNNRQYYYSVTGKVFLERGEEIPNTDLTNQKNVLVLVSCWPPGSSLRRIAVTADLK